MKKKDYALIIEQVKALPPEIILAAANICDGHSIFDPKAFITAGLPETVVAHLTREYQSDGSPKGTLFVHGQAVKALTGVYGLEMLRFLASVLNVEYRGALGRGFEAQNILAALHQHFQKTAAATTPLPKT